MKNNILFILSIIIGVASVLGAIVGSYFMLAVGVWNLIQGWGALTFGQFCFNLMLIVAREFIVAIFAFIGLGIAYVIYPNKGLL